MKGISPLVGFTVVVLLSVSAIAIVIMFGLPLVEMGRESAVINEAQQNMRLLDNLIRESAAEGAGSVKKAHLSVSGGTYFVNPETDSLDYELVLQSDFLPKGTFTRDGKIRTSVTGVVSATDNTTHLILESEVLEVVFEKVGSETAFDSMNTSDVIKTITLKDGDAVIAPNDTSVIIGGIANTSWGTGYTKIAREGINLPRADVLAHVRSNTSGLEYEVIYTLYGSVDYLLVDVRNVSANRTTLNYAYGIGANSSDNIKVGSIGNITTFVAGGETEETTIAEDTVNLDNTNYTKNSSTFVFGSGNGVVSYNASDGTWRNVTELSDIGQGKWTYTHSSSNTTLNFTLAGSDGWDFGVRDSRPGGSYWLEADGTLHGMINVSNDFITVGMTETELVVYNRSGKKIFNTSFNDAVRVDGQDMISLYGSGTQNKTVYFFDWANQRWVEWGKSTGGSLCPTNHTDNGDGTCTFGYTAGTYSSNNPSSTAGASSSCLSPFVASGGSRVRLGNSADSAENCDLLSVRWNISTIPDNSVITSVKVRYDIESSGDARNCDWRQIDNDPNTASATVLWNDIQDGDVYASNNPDCKTVANDYELDLGGNAIADMQNNLNDDWFATGISYVDMTRSSGVHRFSTFSNTSELKVVYIPPQPPDWLDPRNKQQFRWRYALERAGEPKVNLTYLMTAHDPFVRTFVDADPVQFFEGFDDVLDSSIWTITTASGGSGSSNGDGTYRLSVPATSGADVQIDAGKFFNTSASDSFVFETKIVSATDPYILVFGLTQSRTYLAEQNKDSLLFDVTTTDPNILAITQNGASSTSMATIARDSNSHIYRIERDARNSSARFYIDGVLRATSVTNLPNERMFPFVELRSNGAAETADIDYIKVWTENNIILPFSLPENRTAVTAAEDGLIAYWNFNEGQGGNVSDVSGNGNTGNLGNGTATTIPSWVSDSSCRLGNCLGFDGGDLVERTSVSDSVIKSASIWFKPDSDVTTSSGCESILQLRKGGSGDEFEILTGDCTSLITNEIITILHDSGRTGVTGGSISSSAWHNLVVSWNGAQSRYDIYLDGSLQSVTSGSASHAPLLSDANRLTVGSRFLGGTNYDLFFNGMVDDFKVYTRTLDASEVKQLYLTGINQQKPGIYFTKNNATDNEEVLFATTNFKNINRTTPSNFQIFSNHTDFFGFNYTFNSTQNRNFLFALGTMGRMNTTVFDPQNNATQFSGETIESVANSTLTYYDFVNGTSAKGSSWNVTDHGGGIVGHNFTSTFRYDGGAAGIWRFDEGAGLNATDSSGNGNTGTVDATWTDNASCRIGGCLIFDGSSDEVIVAHSDSVGMTGAITMEAWVKPRSVSSGDVFVFAKNFNPAGDISYGLRRVTDKFQLYLKKKGFVGTPINGKAGLVAERWYHVVGTWDGFTARLYVNGVLEVSRGFTGPLDINNRDLGIGDWTDLGGYNWNGIIDEARLYPYALTESDVRDHYQRGVTKYYDDFGTAAYGRTYRHFGVEDSNTTLQPVTPKDAVLHLRFNDNSTVNVTDSSGMGRSGGVINGAAWLTNSSCRSGFGGCMSFDGSNDNIRLPDGTFPTGQSPRTFCFWAEPKVTSEVDAIFSGLQAANDRFVIRLNEFSSANDVTVISGFPPARLLADNVLTQNEWNHVCASYDGTGAVNTVTTKIYVNGLQQPTSLSGTANTPATSASNHVIGFDPVNSIGYYRGLIDEVIAVNRSLSADEVYQLYLGGYQRRSGDLVGWWKFNQNVTNGTLDSSGNGNTGSLFGVRWNATGRIGAAYEFDGVDDYVGDIGTKSTFNFVQNTGVFSVGGWIRVMDLSKPYQVIVGNTPTGAESGFFLRYINESASRMRALELWLTSAGTGGIIDSFSPNNVVNDSDFHHVIAVGNGTNVIFYVDGVQYTGSGSMGAKSTGDSTRVLNIGRTSFPGSEYYFNGTIDDVKIWRRALTADEVAHEYQQGLQGNDRESIYGRVHRVAAADGLTSVAFNLTDHNNTFEGADYDMRVLLFNGTATTTTQSPGAPAANCFTLLNTTQAYACSFDDSEYSSTKASGIVFAGDLDRFSSVCNDKVVGQSGAPYKFNLTATGQIRAVLPFATATCTDVGNKTDNILDLGVPGTNFGSYALRGLANLLMSLQYERIQVGGDFRAGSGAHDVCVKKTGSEGRTVTVNVTGC